MDGNLEDKYDFAVGIKVVLQYLPAASIYLFWQCNNLNLTI
ncbi:Hypothetical protein c0809 [Escherichia coli CFT073]|uniref:Uncharacterized protein n=1 Tax=Escherichia coli O6:H1 (strain CFT073 / ATCC 700928 / UPEC) TaxID=199310 RepID=A0A0H2V603_ECOL6|nr:Hypothetical protein c0809 [Escherichia coli CFT073]